MATREPAPDLETTELPETGPLTIARRGASVEGVVHFVAPEATSGTERLFRASASSC